MVNFNELKSIANTLQEFDKIGEYMQFKKYFLLIKKFDRLLMININLFFINL